MPAKPKKILVVEDDVTMREIVAQKLSSSGYQVSEAENGVKGMEIINSEKPDLILLDLMLPELDGFGVLEQTRKHQDAQIAKIPVIILSNLWSKDEIVRTKQLGVSAYVIKAYMTTEEILDKINEIFKQEQAPA